MDLESLTRGLHKHFSEQGSLHYQSPETVKHGRVGWFLTIHADLLTAGYPESWHHPKTHFFLNWHHWLHSINILDIVSDIWMPNFLGNFLVKLFSPLSLNAKIKQKCVHSGNHPSLVFCCHARHGACAHKKMPCPSFFLPSFTFPLRDDSPFRLKTCSF